MIHFIKLDYRGFTSTKATSWHIDNLSLDCTDVDFEEKDGVGVYPVYWCMSRNTYFAIDLITRRVEHDFRQLMKLQELIESDSIPDLNNRTTANRTEPQ